MAGRDAGAAGIGVLEARGTVPAVLLLNGSQMVRLSLAPLLVGMFLEPSDVGVYTAAMRTATLASFVLGVASVVAQPRLSALYAAGSRRELSRFVALTTGGIFLASLAIALFIAVFGKTMLALFGEEFVAGYPVLLILTAGHLAAAAFGPVTSLLTMTGYERTAALMHAASLLTSVALNVLLVPRFGIIAQVSDELAPAFVPAAYVLCEMASPRGRDGWTPTVTKRLSIGLV